MYGDFFEWFTPRILSYFLLYVLNINYFKYRFQSTWNSPYYFTGIYNVWQRLLFYFSFYESQIIFNISWNNGARGKNDTLLPKFISFFCSVNLTFFCIEHILGMCRGETTETKYFIIHLIWLTYFLTFPYWSTFNREGYESIPGSAWSPL